jgi:hypothetical protein
MASMSASTTDGAVFHGPADGVLTSDELEKASRSYDQEGGAKRCCCLSPKVSTLMLTLSILLAIGLCTWGLVDVGLFKSNYYYNYEPYGCSNEGQFILNGCEMQTVPLPVDPKGLSHTAVANIEDCECLNKSAAASLGLLCTKLTEGPCISSSQLFCGKVIVDCPDFDYDTIPMSGGVFWANASAAFWANVSASSSVSEGKRSAQTTDSKCYVHPNCSAVDVVKDYNKHSQRVCDISTITTCATIWPMCFPPHELMEAGVATADDRGPG